MRRLGFGGVRYDSHDLVPQLHRGLPSPHVTFIVPLGPAIVSGTTPAEPCVRAVASHQVLVAGVHDAPTFVVQPVAQSAWLAEERRNIQAGGHVRGADSGA